MHATDVELRILRDASYVLTCFSEGYFGDSKTGLSDLIESLELPEASGTPLSRFLEGTRAVYQGVRASDAARREAVQRFCQIDNEMWQIILSRRDNAPKKDVTTDLEPSGPSKWMVAAKSALSKPHVLFSVLWLLSAIAFATYEVHTLPYKSTGWLFYFAGYGLGYPRPIGWLFVASILVIIWLSGSGRLAGSGANLARLAVVAATIVAIAIPAWLLSTPRTKADCYLKYIKAGMSDQAVRDIRSACQAKYP